MTAGEAFPAGDPYMPSSAYGAASAASTATGERPQIAYDAAEVVTGRLRAVLGPPPAGKAWEVRRITVSATDAASRPEAYVYVGADTATANLVFGTVSGALDCADNSAVFVPEGSRMIVEWTTATGSAGARIEYVEV